MSVTIHSEKPGRIVKRSPGELALIFQEQRVNGPGTAPLLLGLAAGDERAFAVLYDRFGTRMYRAAVRMLDSAEDAEDAVQDVFLAVARSREKLAEVRDLTAYLFAALHHAAGRLAQRRVRSPQQLSAPADEPIAPADPVWSDRRDWHRLQQAVRALPEPQREVLTLKIDAELTFTQIAEVMGASLSTTVSRYRYALHKLRASLVDVKRVSGGEP